jgi:Transglycosylase SLT domain
MKRLQNLVWLVAIAALSFGADAQAQQRAQYEALVAAHAKANLVPEELVHRVIVRESKYHPNLLGRGGAIGLMQIKLPTARGLGYTGDAAGLRDPETNLTYGIKYLAGAYRAAGGDHDRAVHYYASGYYYAAKRQRIEHVTEAKSTPVSAPPKELPKPEQQAPTEAKEAVVAAPEAVVEPKEAAKPVDAAATPKVVAAKPKRHPRKLADAKTLVPRPPASIPGGANVTKPR